MSGRHANQLAADDPVWVLRRILFNHDPLWCLDCRHAESCHTEGPCAFVTGCDCPGFVSHDDYTAALDQLVKEAGRV